MNIILYTTTAFVCPYCERSKAKLKELGYGFTERDISDPAIKTELLTKVPTVKTIPQIFVGDHHIGGSTDLTRLIKSGEFDDLVSKEIEKNVVCIGQTDMGRLGVSTSVGGK